MTKFYEEDENEERRTVPVQSVIILSASLDEARRICNAARWPRGGLGSPRLFDVRNGVENTEKLQGIRGGLVLITEGAMKHGVPEHFFMMAIAHNMIVMCMAEPKFAENTITAKNWEIKI